MYPLYLTTDKGDGGPTRAELLELLHNCDVSCGTSSLVSSRAPSPSPSLLSLIFPGHSKATPSQHGGSLAPPTLSLSASNIFRLAGSSEEAEEGITSSCSHLSLSVAPPLHAGEGHGRELLQQKPGFQAENRDELNNLSFQSAGTRAHPAADITEGTLPPLPLSRRTSPIELPGDSRPASSNSDATLTPGGTSQGPSSSCSSPQRCSPVPLPPKNVDQSEIGDSSLQLTEC